MEHKIEFKNLKSKIHPAIKYFRQLHKATHSTLLDSYLSEYVESKTIDSETFTTGVKKFIKLANIKPAESRATTYGTIYSGLHYHHDLAQLWNEEHTPTNRIKASQLCTLAPRGWDYIIEHGFSTLIYKGQHPAEALDKLVTGPTVIDCGMFCQLSLWFGIRYMLGNKRFNECFGRAPFFITQALYNKIDDPEKPFQGNPLFAFLSSEKTLRTAPVKIQHLSNTPLYPFKHPGGNYNGENCIIINDKYNIFDPFLNTNQDITKSNVLDILMEAFNQEKTIGELDYLSAYAETPDRFHPGLSKTFGELIVLAEQLEKITLTKEEFFQIEQEDFELGFDLNKFLSWLHQLDNQHQLTDDDYLPKPINPEYLPFELLNSIPFENRNSMDFSLFKQETPQQIDLIKRSQQFCQNVMMGKAQLLILTGKAGIGKTASAVCAAKELAARGKKVVWISEVMVKGWLDQAKSIEDIARCELPILNLLGSNPDVIFMDDNNLIGVGGFGLLEKIYSWYVNNPNKGLFITSNEMIRFEGCYGYTLDQKYHFPPFNHYDSLQYLNWSTQFYLAGESLRARKVGQSIGAIVSDFTWKKVAPTLGPHELIPDFTDSELAPIRQSLKKTESYQCEAYTQLRPVQKRWLKVHEVGGDYFRSLVGHSFYQERHLTVIPLKFEKTSYQTIAIELTELIGFSQNDIKKIAHGSLDQLIRVLNYAHDQGGRRIIIINQTSFDTEQLLTQIKTQLDPRERERTWARLNLLLCETEDTIFNLKQYDGHIAFSSQESENRRNTNQVDGFNSIRKKDAYTNCERKKPRKHALGHKLFRNRKTRPPLSEANQSNLSENQSNLNNNPGTNNNNSKETNDAISEYTPKF